MACSQTQRDRPRGPVAARAFATPGFGWRIVPLADRDLRLYLQRGSDADANADVVADSVKRAQTDVLALLGEPSYPRDKSVHGTANDMSGDNAELFFVRSRADMRRIAGRPLAGFVQPGEATAFFVWSGGYRAPLRHELAHLYTFERWGRPRAGDRAAWLVEGIGAWIGGACQGHSADALTADLLARGRLPSVNELAANFRSLPEDVALPAAGSLTEFLYSREGITGLQRRWSAVAANALPDAAAERAWRAHLNSVRPESLDIARVLREGC
ncbi:MAG: hypothetical protein ACJ79B_03645 [Gemmatimonadaceae bacterium]